MTTKTWSETEMDALARTLVETFPDRRFQTIAHAHQIKLNDIEFTPVMKACLEPARHSLRPRLNRLKRELMSAFTRISSLSGNTPSTRQEAPYGVARPNLTLIPSPAEKTPQAASRPATVADTDADEESGTKTKIRWSQDEWRFFALALHTLNPELHLISASDLSCLTLHQINLAASMMEENRRRKFKRLGGVTDQLAEIYADARKRRDPVYFGKPPTTPPVDAAPTPAETRTTRAAPARPGIFWTAEEYRAIAAQLTPNYPRATIDGHVPGLNITDLNAAIRKALPPERQRKMANQAHLTSFGRRLRDTLEGKPIWGAEQFAQHRQVIRTGEDNPAGQKRVLWTVEEWDDLARKLCAMMPRLETSLDYLTLAMLNEAAATMTRPRRFFNIPDARKHLDSALARIKADAPLPEDDPSDTVQDDSPVAVAPAEPVAGTPPANPADKLFARIEWTREEWLLIAEELHRLHQVQNYPFGHSLVGLETEDIAFAQERVLPLERQRRHLKVASFSTLRAPLERAFADLRAKLEGRAPVQELPTAVEPPVAAPTITADVVAPALEMAGAIAQTIDPYRAAFEPLVALLGGEVAKHLAPMIQTMIDQAISKLPAAIPVAPAAPPAMPYPGPQLVASTPAPAAPAVVKHYGDEKPHVDKPKRLVLGILVNRTSQYKHELEKAFPMLDVRCVDTDCKASVDRVSQADKVIGMERFVSHPCTAKLKKLVGDRYTPCNGAMSELKRIITIWLKAQGYVVEHVA
jgi:hypothetical protein